MKLTTEQREWLALTMVPGVGTTHFIRLLARFRTPGNVLKAPRASLQDIVGPKLAERISEYSEAADVDAQERAMESYRASLITMNDALYPARLGEIYDPPLVLFVRGELREEDERAVAIVGTRGATPYGIRIAERLAGDLAASGVTIVSGMASGIDAAAHRGALEAGGRTIAVLGNGVDRVYPEQNADLMHKIIAQGAVVSQFTMGTKPSKGHFPYRNRIISGMSLGVVIVQAPLKSGALITAHQAAEQGREVFAVPGDVGNENSQGPHALIREGAKLVESANDILIELNLAGAAPVPRIAWESPETAAEPLEEAVRTAPKAAKTAPEPPRVAAAAGAERDILSVLSADGSYVDEIAASCRISVAEALSSLTLLELKGLVRQFSGKRFAPR